MSPSPGQNRRQPGRSVSVSLRWTVFGLLAFNLLLWGLIIGAVRRAFD